MAVTGNTRYPEYRRLTLLYEFEKLKAFTRRSITPTDIDGRFLIHSGSEYNGGKGDFFLWLDLKTDDTLTSKPQRDAFDALLWRGFGADALLIAEHPQLEEGIAFPDMATRFAWRMYDRAKGGMAQTGWLKPGADRNIGWWVQQWFAHAEDKLNSFVTAFRQASGIYPQSKSRWRMEWLDDA